MSLLIDTILLVALVVTTVSVVSVRQKLRALDGQNEELNTAIESISASLDNAGKTITRLRDEGCAVSASLGVRLDEARMMMDEIDVQLRRLDKASARRQAPPRHHRTPPYERAPHRECARSITG